MKQLRTLFAAAGLVMIFAALGSAEPKWVYDSYGPGAAPNAVHMINDTEG
ncbi:MAG: hypothetical protein AB1393_06610 [Candidatus Edwardsbacteria bacterium]